MKKGSNVCVCTRKNTLQHVLFECHIYAYTPLSPYALSALGFRCLLDLLLPHLREVSDILSAADIQRVERHHVMLVRRPACVRCWMGGRVDDEELRLLGTSLMEIE